MLRLSDIARRMFRRAVANRRPAPFRSRLEVITLEDRVVPSTVAVSLHSDTGEGYGPGAFQFTRTGNISQTITVNYSVSGSATPSDDYPTLSGQVTFWSNESTAYAYVSPNDDFTAEFDESVVVTLESGSGYTVGAPDSATLILTDNEEPVVTVEKLNDVTEGSNSLFRLVRQGDKSGTLTVNYSIGGTADSGDDFTAVSGSVVFAAGEVSADVSVTAVPDTISDPDETVELTVTSGTGYTVGSPSSASLTIADDFETVETLVHEEEFQLTGTGGNADIALTVTYNATGVTGLYTWSYTVSNPSSNTTSWTKFEIPVDNTEDLSDVGNLTSSLGWTGTIGSDTVSWAGGTALAPGQSATFSFTTEPRAVGPGTVEVTGAGGTLSAELPTAPVPREKPVASPRGTYSFFAGLQNGTLTFSITTASGDTSTPAALPINLASAGAARDYVFNYLKDSGWAVEKIGADSIEIRGFIKPDKSIDGVRTISITVANWFQAGAVKPMATGGPNVTAVNN